MEKHLVLKLKNNESDAVDALIDIYSAYVFTVVRNFSGNLLSNEDIEECVADTFFSLWRARDNIREDLPLKPYLAVIAKNSVKNKIRDISKCFHDKLPFDLSDSGFIEEYEKSLDIESIYQAISTLNNVQAQLFIRFYFYGEKLKDIAADIGVSQENAKVSLHRTRKTIKKFLTERGRK